MQSGWLRASHRKLDAAMTTKLRPWHTDTAEDAAPLPAGKFVKARVELFPFAAVFRAGSRVRITVEAPGGNRPLWTFDSLPGFRHGHQRHRPFDRPPVAGGVAGHSRHRRADTPAAVPVAARPTVPHCLRRLRAHGGESGGGRAREGQGVVAGADHGATGQDDQRLHRARSAGRRADRDARERDVDEDPRATGGSAQLHGRGQLLG